MITFKSAQIKKQDSGKMQHDGLIRLEKLITLGMSLFRRPYRSLILIVPFLFFDATEAKSCLCFNINTPAEELKDAAMVFYGRVIKREKVRVLYYEGESIPIKILPLSELYYNFIRDPNWHRAPRILYKTTFLIYRVHKGQHTDTAVIYTPHTVFSDCMPQFEMGDEAVVYCWKRNTTDMNGKPLAPIYTPYPCTRISYYLDAWLEDKALMRIESVRKKVLADDARKKRL